ncbi:hypothetical protein ABW19_dt0205919 [Dactylella cylindrospora]|nr:hypothetical protein ABW19_dt0205919 [Dactylella cylindrospora]
MQRLEQKSKEETISLLSLPVDVLNQVLDYLDHDTLIAASRVSKSCRRIVVPKLFTTTKLTEGMFSLLLANQDGIRGIRFVQPWFDAIGQQKLRNLTSLHIKFKGPVLEEPGDDIIPGVHLGVTYPTGLTRMKVELLEDREYPCWFNPFLWMSGSVDTLRSLSIYDYEITSFEQFRKWRQGSNIACMPNIKELHIQDNFLENQAYIDAVLAFWPNVETLCIFGEDWELTRNVSRFRKVRKLKLFYGVQRWGPPDGYAHYDVSRLIRRWVNAGMVDLEWVECTICAYGLDMVGNTQYGAWTFNILVALGDGAINIHVGQLVFKRFRGSAEAFASMEFD